mmetsp:Transcript_98426/g.175292  ORF Transcript_98426/g.175292 Transcript_98426/m.175292 type:complete len:110 (-) Transcript_98426:75-404(-)
MHLPSEGGRSFWPTHSVSPRLAQQPKPGIEEQVESLQQESGDVSHESVDDDSLSSLDVLVFGQKPGTLTLAHKVSWNEPEAAVGPRRVTSVIVERTATILHATLVDAEG